MLFIYPTVLLCNRNQTGTGFTPAFEVQINFISAAEGSWWQFWGSTWREKHAFAFSQPGAKPGGIPPSLPLCSEISFRVLVCVCVPLWEHPCQNCWFPNFSLHLDAQHCFWASTHVQHLILMGREHPTLSFQLLFELWVGLFGALLSPCSWVQLLCFAFSCSDRQCPGHSLSLWQPRCPRVLSVALALLELTELPHRVAWASPAAGTLISATLEPRTEPPGKLHRGLQTHAFSLLGCKVFLIRFGSLQFKTVHWILHTCPLILTFLLLKIPCSQPFILLSPSLCLHLLQGILLWECPIGGSALKHSSPKTQKELLKIVYILGRTEHGKTLETSLCEKPDVYSSSFIQKFLFSKRRLFFLLQPVGCL